MFDRFIGNHNVKSLQRRRFDPWPPAREGVTRLINGDGEADRNLVL